MCENLDDWKPMEEDFKSISFNSYSRGPGAQLPHNFNNNISSSLKSPQKYKLYIDGFSSELTETGLKAFLCGIGCNPLRLKIVHSKTRLGKTFSFVEFGSKKDALKAIELIKSQKIYKLFVSFASTEFENENKDYLISKEKQDFENQFIEMKPKIALTNGSTSVTHLNSNSFSPMSSESGSGGDTSLCDAMSSLASINKLVKVLQEVDADCSFCNETSHVEHVHLILSDQQVIDPSQMPQLVEIDLKCVVCGKKDLNPKFCSQCKSAVYCSRKCQSSNWMKHRVECEANGEPTQTSDSALIDSKRSGNMISNESQIQKKSEPISSPSNVTQITEVEAHKQTTPLAITVSIAQKQKVSETKSVSQKTNDTQTYENREHITHNISIETINQNKSPQITISSERPNSNSVQTKANRINHKIVPFRGVVLLEEFKDGEENVNICFGRDPSDFYLNKSSSEEKMAVFAEELNEKMNEYPQLPERDLIIGSLCGGIYSEDGMCYRARIIDKVGENVFALQFIDYGNIEEVKVEDIKALPPIFFDCKAQAIHCGLYNVKPKGGKTWDKNKCELFAKLGESQKYNKLKIFEKKSEDFYLIDLFDKNENSMIGELVEKKVCKKVDSKSSSSNDELKAQINENSIRSPKSTPILSPKKITVNSPPISPKVTFNKSSLINFVAQEKRNDSDSVETNGKFEIKSYLNTIENNSTINFFMTEALNDEELQYWAIMNTNILLELRKDLENDYSSAPKCLPIEGQIFVTKSSDEDYRRSYVLEVDDKVAKVFDIDSGLYEETDNFYKMTPKYSKIPALVMLLIPKTKIQIELITLNAIKDMPIVEGIVVKKDQKQYIKTGEEMIEALDYKSSIPLVIIKMKSQPKEDNSLKIVDHYSKLNANKLPLNKRMEVFVVYQEVENPKIFYVGDEAMLATVMPLSSSLSAKYSVNKSVKPKVGKIYLARNSDGDWYRALVTSVGSDKCNVLFTDFGNQEEIDSKYVMKLTSALKLDEMPAIAVRCEVHSTELSQVEVDKKISQASDGVYLLKIEVIKYENAIHYVKVY